MYELVCINKNLFQLFSDTGLNICVTFWLCILDIANFSKKKLLAQNWIFLNHRIPSKYIVLLIERDEHCLWNQRYYCCDAIRVAIPHA